MKAFDPRKEWARFMKFVDRTGPCWVWRGAPGSGGYGRVRKRNGPPVYAHRRSWEMHFGPIPPGLKVLHQCDNPPCVNPAHLFLGTLRDNTQDMMRKGRARHGPVTGTDNPRCRLRESEVLQIRASTEPHAVVARKFRCSPALVSQIRRRKVWGHLPGPIARWRDGRKGRHADQKQGTEARIAKLREKAGGRAGEGPDRQG